MRTFRHNSPADGFAITVGPRERMMLAAKETADLFAKFNLNDAQAIAVLKCVELLTVAMPIGAAQKLSDAQISEMLDEIVAEAIKKGDVKA